MVSVVACDPCVFARGRASVADPCRHAFGPLECSARFCCWTQRTLKWTLTDPHKDPSGVGPGRKAVWLRVFVLSLSLRPCETLSSVLLRHFLSFVVFLWRFLTPWMQIPPLMLRFSYSFLILLLHFTQTPWSWCPRPPSSGALHVKAFMTLFYLYIFWKLHLNIFQKQRALIKSRLYISFIAAPSISESQWLEKSNSLFTLPSSPWQIEVQFAALWQRPLSPKIAPINFCTVLLPITWSGA